MRVLLVGGENDGRIVDAGGLDFLDIKISGKDDRPQVYEVYVKDWKAKTLEDMAIPYRMIGRKELP
jgi:hypothetical protein